MVLFLCIIQIEYNQKKYFAMIVPPVIQLFPLNVVVFVKYK